MALGIPLPTTAPDLDHYCQKIADVEQSLETFKIQTVEAPRLPKNVMQKARKTRKLVQKEEMTRTPLMPFNAPQIRPSLQNLFTENFYKMNKHAQDFMLMQLKLANKKKKGNRFTEDEKLLALSLMKESPKGYRLLQKIFKLPTKKTLDRLAENKTRTAIENLED